jgi:hypothetical protein
VVEKQGEEAVASEVEKRLDDIFGIEDEDDGDGSIEEGILIEDYNDDEDDDDHPTTFEENILYKDSPLMDLKGVVLSIEWEITDEIMDRFIEEVGILKAKYSDDKIPHMYLKILDSVGRYIRKRKVQSHPESVLTLNSVYNSFEKVMLSKTMSKTDKRKALYEDINRFKRLKEDIARDRPDQLQPMAAKKKVPEVTKDAYIARPASTEQIPKAETMPPHEAFAYALEEIKQVIKVEFQALRAELKLWREGQ